MTQLARARRSRAKLMRDEDRRGRASAAGQGHAQCVGDSDRCSMTTESSAVTSSFDW
jgi:hypothetical protein